MHSIALSINIHAGLVFNYNVDDCLIESVLGFLTVPSAVLGQPVSVQEIVDDILNAGNAGKVPLSN